MGNKRGTTSAPRAAKRKATPAAPKQDASRDPPGETFVVTRLAPPVRRPLRAYAFDPSRGRQLGNQMKLDVRYRKLHPGPVTVDHDPDAIAVIDYDATRGTYYTPVDLEDRWILVRNGLEPTESDPRFHQQMVYAVASETIEHFEAALGRRIHWRRAERSGSERGWLADDIVTLNLYPHAMRARNAFYCPEAHGILFGYFAAEQDDPGRNLPGQPIFTCLSHDIVVHEVTHAIVDGLRAHFIEQTNVDVAAFHEAFADLAALFRHFSHREVLLDTLQRTGGKLYSYQLRPDATSDAGATPAGIRGVNPVAIAAQIKESNPLIDLAQQFGEATGLRGGLRKALGFPATPDALKQTIEPHQRGSILVAAVFDAYFSVYVRRTADLYRIFRAGGGSDDPIDLPAPLANQLADVATRTAEEFFAMCVRALDYCPPVDITFGEFLRALITSEVDRSATDPDGIRDALMQAFRLRGIYPDGARFFSEDALCWNHGADLGLPLLTNLTHIGDPNGLTPGEAEGIRAALTVYVDQPEVKARLGLSTDIPFSVPSFHPVFRLLDDGSLHQMLVAEVVQTTEIPYDDHAPAMGAFTFRAGATLLIQPRRTTDEPGRAEVRWVITKPMLGAEADRRRERQQAFAQRIGLVDGGEAGRFRINFALVHGGL